jgi:hypothetical protein
MPADRAQKYIPTATAPRTAYENQVRVAMSRKRPFWKNKGGGLWIRSASRVYSE